MLVLGLQRSGNGVRLGVDWNPFLCLKSKCKLGDLMEEQRKRAKIPCTLLESGFQMPTQDSSDGVHAFSCCGWIWLRTLELAPFTDVQILFPAWH